MRKTKPGLNVLLPVTYLLIVLAVLIIITLSVTSYLGRYFLSARAKAQQKALDKCALSMTPFLEDRDPDEWFEILSRCAMEENGRVLFLDMSGCVQTDTFCLLNGTRPDSPEIADILSGKTDAAVGYHKLTLTENTVTRDNPYLTVTRGKYWAAYYTCGVIAGGKTHGVLLLVSPVQDIVDNVSHVALFLFLLDLIFSLAVAGLSFYLSNYLTLSLRRFNRAVARMTDGDFSARVDEKEIAELGELARAFNMMSEKMENLDSSRSTFVSDASHELKTPLASMKILSESLLEQEEVPAETYREFLGDIRHEVDRLTLVINDLLTLVKTDKGTDTLVIGEVELGDVLKRIVGTVAPLAAQKHITVSFEYVDVSVQADSLRIQQVFTNLIDNAVKYSPENTTISVSLSETSSGAVVKVADQGIGISEEDLPHLFERFYRVDKARSRQAGGTGLGLSIVKQIVDQHHGTITVQSEVGRGTAFTVTLPKGE